MDSDSGPVFHGFFCVNSSSDPDILILESHRGARSEFSIHVDLVANLVIRD